MRFEQLAPLMAFTLWSSISTTLASLQPRQDQVIPVAEGDICTEFIVGQPQSGHTAFKRACDVNDSPHGLLFCSTPVENLKKHSWIEYNHNENCEENFSHVSEWQWCWGHEEGKKACANDRGRTGTYTCRAYKAVTSAHVWRKAGGDNRCGDGKKCKGEPGAIVCEV